MTNKKSSNETKQILSSRGAEDAIMIGSSEAHNGIGVTLDEYLAKHEAEDDIKAEKMILPDAERRGIPCHSE